MKIKIADIPQEGLEIRISFPVREMKEFFPKNDAILNTVVKPTSLEVQLTKVETKVYVKGVVRTVFRPSCDYCNEVFDCSIEAPISMLLFPPELVMVPADCVDEVDRYDGVAVDLMPMMIEQLTLAVPMTFKCTDDCPGLCHICGANRRKHPCQCEIEKQESPFAVLIKLKVK